MQDHKRKLIIALGAVALALTITLTSFVTVQVHNYVLAREGDRVVLTGEQYTNWQQSRRLNEIAAIIGEEFIDKTSNEDLYIGAARGMIEALGDEYARYYTPEEYKQYQEQSKGVYAGVGAAVMLDPADNLTTVTQVYEDSPAAKAGIRKDDKIIMVDDVDVRSMNLDDTAALMQGEQGSKVTLTVLRDGKTMEFKLERDVVTIDRVEQRMLDTEIAYLKITEFQGNDVTQFKKALESFKEDNAKGLVIDLRDNPGGLLDDAVAIADLLTPEGWVVYTENRSGTRQVYSSDADSYGLPLVILVNENSASASEVLAGCIQDHGVGTLVGTKTYGKGVVQSIHFFKEDAAGMKLTTARYYTPKGRCIDGTGLEPDVKVELPEDILSGEVELTDENDTQLQKAIEILQEEIKAK